MASIGKVILVEDDELDAEMTRRTLQSIPLECIAFVAQAGFTCAQQALQAF